MRAKDWRCPFSDLPGDQLHHLSGRGAEGNYLFPDLVVPLVKTQHVLEHQAWRVAEVTDGRAGDPAVLFLMRSGLFMVRLADNHGDGVVTLPAFTLLELGRALMATAHTVEPRSNR